MCNMYIIYVYISSLIVDKRPSLRNLAFMASVCIHHVKLDSGMSSCRRVQWQGEHQGRVMAIVR